jgi:hypothetical protein
MVPLSTEYELLVRDLHQALLSTNLVRSIAVEHNAKIRGKSGALHQIDVYWQFEAAGVKYKTCVECKHHNRNISKSAVAAFVAILNDIGNSTGVFVTTIGYQPGAKAMAEAGNIRLLVVNHLLKSIFIQSHFVIPDTEITNLKYDNDQVKGLLKAQGLQTYMIQKLIGPQTQLHDELGSPVETLRDYLNRSIGEDGEGSLFPVQAYDKLDIGFAKIERIDYRRRTTRMDANQEIITNSTARAILEDVATNTVQYLHDDGSVSTEA